MTKTETVLLTSTEQANYPIPVVKLINWLNGRLPVTNHELQRFVTGLSISETDLISFSRYNHDLIESYGRVEVYAGRNFMVYVMSWLPGDFTAIHSHGRTDWGVVCYFGNADHRIYRARGRDISLFRKETIPAGSIIPVTGDFVHAMGNLSDRPFLTLHVYGSNKFEGVVTEDSDIYSLEQNRIGRSTGPAFLNMKEEMLKSVTMGVETDKATLLDYYKLITPFYERNGIVMPLDQRVTVTLEGY